MNSDAEMTTEISSGAVYGTDDPDTIHPWSFCFAVTFDEQTDNKYIYNLRYNETGPPNIDDIHDTELDQIVMYKVED